MGKARLLDELPSKPARPIESIAVLMNDLEPKNHGSLVMTGANEGLRTG